MYDVRRTRVWAHSYMYGATYVYGQVRSDGAEALKLGLEALGIAPPPYPPPPPGGHQRQGAADAVGTHTHRPIRWSVPVV